jgi:hypothetical protein
MISHLLLLLATPQFCPLTSGTITETTGGKYRYRATLYTQESYEYMVKPAMS